ncbi:MAG TPA: GntR family transcriptional regulator [Modicisalibacter sp.]|nr:GntR family transcriptional regulator [Modicisalibacter sp.]
MRIVKASLHEEAADRIRDQINEGKLVPGSRIPERQLCEQFGISRTPLREALKALAVEGLVELTQNRGAQVVKLDRADIASMFQVIGALEALAGELACACITDQELANVRALHYQMLVHYERRELPQYFHCNQQIHEAIIAAARNAPLTQVYESLSGRLQRARYLASTSQQRWDEAVHEHELILEALTARDGKRLARILREHLDHKFVAVCETQIVSSGKEEADPGIAASE